LIGFPVMGDPSYGANNHDAAGLKLTAWGLEFTSPFTGGLIKFQIAGF
jgi:23S rRNA-/tRNA-specific pseudouridylate synthase